MREAIGGTMLMYIVMFFLVVYICFMAVVINYGRVFRVKNSVISYIEQYEGVSSTDSIKSYASSMGYTGDMYICYTEGSGNNKYFSVRLAIEFQLPLVSNSVKVWISGETSAINISSKGNYNSVSKCGTGSTKWNGAKI